jgi:signal recognition particle receptor subunit beta
MVELNHRQRTIKVKIVFYGPPVGGKTTNLQVLHQNVLPGRRGEMVSINSAQDRTILFDMLPMKAAGFRGFDLRLQVLAVPGQGMYAATRRLVLKGADAIVFVANSATDRWEENVQSFREMTGNLLDHQLDPASLPLVIQYNKRDLPDVTPLDFMDRTLNARGVASLPAVAIRGEGVLETFSAILAAAMDDLAVRYQIAEINKGQRLDQWTHHTVLGMFGTTSLTPTAPAEETKEPRSAVFFPPKAEELPAVDRRSIRIALPEEAVQLSSVGPSARGNEALVESYAEASTRLTADLGEMREARQRAEQRLEQIQLVQEALHEVGLGQPIDPALRSVLGVLTEAGAARYGSLLLPVRADRLRAAALKGIDEDPLLKGRGARAVLERCLKEVEPRIQRATDSLDLGEALDDPVRPFGALMGVPARTPEGLRALILLYYTPDDALPGAEELDHLAALARTLATGLVLVSALQKAREAEGVLHLAMTGMLSLRGLEEILVSVLALRDRLAEMRRHIEAVPALRDDFGGITPSLAGALSLARSILTFGREDVQREVVDMKELLGDLSAGGITVALAPDLGTLLGDPHLIRLGFLLLAEHYRRAGISLEARAVAEGGFLKVYLWERAGAESSRPGPGPRSALPLTLVKKIAELHGGAVNVDRDDGARVSITLTLPLG